MSRDCVDALWKAEIKPATLKLTLMAICDRADNDGYRCYPSIERVSKDTSLNKKTVQANIKKLIDMGLVTDTGRRVGASQRVKVLQVNLELIRKWEDPENGKIDDPENGTLDDPENGMQNQSDNQPINQPDNNDRSDDQSDAVKRGFEYFWKKWKEVKKSVGKLDTSPKTESFEKKWKPLFNSAYFKNHSYDDFRNEVNEICRFIVEAHKVDLYRFENMQVPKLLSQKQWRD